MGTAEIVGWIVSALATLVMFLMKNQMDTQSKQLDNLNSEIKHIKDEYFKKEDFREFKTELWARLDKMELSFENRMGRVMKSYSVSDFPNLPGK